MSLFGTTVDHRPEQQLEAYTTDHSRATSYRSQSPAQSVLTEDIEYEKTTLAVDWDGEDDPEMPYNWSGWKKAAHIIPIGFLTLSVSAGSSMIAPATLVLANEFSVSTTRAILPLSLFVLGLAFGPVLAAPLSESRGRLIVYRVSTPIYILFILGAATTKTMSGLLACRFLAGVFGAPCLAIGPASLTDLYPLRKLGTAGVFNIMTPLLGPCIGPIIGSLAVYYQTWRWTQWYTICLALFALVLVLPMRETHHKILLQRRAARRGLPAAPKPTGMEAVKLLLTVTIARPILMLVTEPIVLLFSIYSAFLFAVLFALFESYFIVFVGVYQFNIWQYGLTFTAVGLGVILGAIVIILFDLTIYQKKVKKGNVRPEDRLYVAMFGAFLIPAGLAWFAWTAEPSTHWMSPVLASIPFTMGNICIFAACILYLGDVYGSTYGASAMAANGLLRYILGAAFPLFVVQMYEQLGIKWATAVFGLISLVLLPIPWLFYVFGSRIRKISSYT